MKRLSAAKILVDKVNLFSRKETGMKRTLMLRNVTFGKYICPYPRWSQKRSKMRSTSRL